MEDIFFSKLFFIFTFLLNIQLSISTLYFTYPTSISLTNGNFFVIHKDGICVCNAGLTSIIQNSYIFDENEKITIDILVNVTIIQFSDGFIISFIKDKLYYFDNTGNFLDKSGALFSQTSVYISISSYKMIDNRYYYFLIGYTYNKLLYLYYYKYYSQDKELSTVAYKTGIYDKCGSTNCNIQSKGVSCEMTYKTSKDIIECTYYVEKPSSYSSSYYVSLALFIINNQYIETYQDTIHYSYKNILLFSSAVNNDFSTAFHCFVDNGGKTICRNYNGADVWTLNEKCSTDNYGLNTYYFPSTEEFAISCLLLNGGIQFVFFNNQLNEVTRFEYKYTDCEEIIRYSLLFSKKKENFYVLSDVQCNGDIYYEKIFSDGITDEIDEEDYNKKEEEEKEEEAEEEEVVEEEEEEVEEEEEEVEEEVEEKEEEKQDEKQEEEEESEEEEKEKQEEEEEEEDEEKEEEEEDEICKEIEKCRYCNKESISKNLCIKCNTFQEYYYLNSFPNKKSMNDEYIDCVNNKTRPSNFYFNEENKDFRPCYETCASCIYGGNGKENNCITCDYEYILKPDIINSTNCVSKCKYLYYYNNLGQYKCTDIYDCPEEYSLFIIEKKKCIDICEKDDTYKYQYNGECNKICPDETRLSADENLCKDINLNKCKLTENQLYYLHENITDEEVDKKAKIYANEFQYTNNHVTIYKNEIYSIILYKNGECISELNLLITEVELGECYNKIKNIYHYEDNNLVIAIITKKINGQIYARMLYFSIYEPNTGEKIPVNNICINDIFSVNENLLIKLDNSTDLEQLKFLTSQNIDIFNLESDFFTDICYSFESPIYGKDIPLKDRIKLYFPNVTLCENGCEIKGVNITTFKAMCKCTLNNFMENNIFGDNFFYQSSVGEIKNMIKQTNIEVLRCYQNIFVLKYFKKNTGGFIILFLILIQIILTIIYYCKYLYLIKKYIFNITDKFLMYLLSIKNNIENIILPNGGNQNLPSIKEKKLIRMKEPPKKQSKINNAKTTKNIVRKGRKGKTILEKKQPKNVKKRASLIPNRNNIKYNLINAYNQNNSNSNSFNKEELVLSHKNMRKRNFKNSTIKPLNSDEKLLSSDLFLSNKYKVPSASIKPNSQDRLIINLKNDLDVDIKEYLSTEPDDMDYADAIKRDNRTFCVYFWDKSKNNSIILSSFLVYEPLRPKPLKLLLFILNIGLYLLVNGLFFSEDYISEVFNVKDEGFLTFIGRFMDRFLYITFVGVILNYIIDCFFVDEKKIKGIFKREKDNILFLKYEINKVIKNIMSRNNFFIIFSFVVSIFILYYVLCFNNVYPSMKEEWIISSIIILASMQILSILQSFLGASIRFISFKCKSEKIYKISLLLA